MRIFVVVWEHRYGQDVWAFTSLESAKEQRRKIAEEWFDKECDHLDKPEDRDDLTDLYFETVGMNAVHFEGCHITECDLED